MTPTDEMKLHLNQLHSRFFYRPDPRLDNWHIVEYPHTLTGDCDDFAATLLWELSERSIVRFIWFILSGRALFWNVTSYRGNAHLVLRFRGLYADNMESVWYTLEDMRHKRRFPVIWPWAFLKLLLGKLRRTP